MNPNENSGFDLMTILIESGLELVAHKILEHLNVLDLKCCQLVSTHWNYMVERLYDHHEWLKVGRGWSQGQPTVKTLHCLSERSTCTVTSLALDEESLVCALGSSGNIELWDRRPIDKDVSDATWRAFAHKDGVYSVDLNKDLVVSGGDDGNESAYFVKVWNRSNGQLLLVLEHHEYIIWSVRLWVDTLISLSHDCTMATMKILLKDGEVSVSNIQKLKGPFEWSDALATDKKGKFLVTHNEENFNLAVWNLNEQLKAQPVTLSGHTADVHCAKFLLPFLASAGEDKTVRIWKLENVENSDIIVRGQCVRILRGHEGKIWSLDADRRRIVAGGRYGEIRIWSWTDVLDTDLSEEQCSGRSLWCHPRSSAVGQICMERALLVTSDGLGQIKFLDFWNLDKTGPNSCGCAQQQSTKI